MRGTSSRPCTRCPCGRRPSVPWPPRSCCAPCTRPGRQHAAPAARRPVAVPARHSIPTRRQAGAVPLAEGADPVYSYRRYRSRRVPPWAVAAVAAAVLLGAGQAAHAGGRPHHHAPSHAALVAIAWARHQLGKPYLWGGTGPGSFDCSGLTYMAWLQAKVSIGRTSQQQWADLPHISEQDLQPGDLVFYVGARDPGEAPPGHVALYIGNGQILEAYATGYPIRITALRPGAWGFARP